MTKVGTPAEPNMKTEHDPRAASTIKAQGDNDLDLPSADGANGAPQRDADVLPVLCVLDADNRSGPYLPLGTLSADGDLSSTFFYDTKAHVLKEVGIEEDVLHVAPLPQLSGASSNGCQLCIAITSVARKQAKVEGDHPPGHGKELRCHLVSCSPLAILSSCSLSHYLSGTQGLEGRRSLQSCEDKRKESLQGADKVKASPGACQLAVSDTSPEDGRMRVVLFITLDGDIGNCVYAPLDIVVDGKSFKLAAGSPAPTEHARFGKCEAELLPVLARRRSEDTGSVWRLRMCAQPALGARVSLFCTSNEKALATKSIDSPCGGSSGRTEENERAVLLTADDGAEFKVLSYHRSTCSFAAAKRFRRLLSASRGEESRGGVLLLNAGLCLEWQWSKADSSCRLVLRETTWGAPCSAVFRVELPSSAAGKTPIVLTTGLDSNHPCVVALIWHTKNAVFSIPLHVRSIRASNAVGALATTTFQGASRSSNAKAIDAVASKRDSLLLAAAGVTNDRDRLLCRNLFSFCQSTRLPEEASAKSTVSSRVLLNKCQDLKEIEKWTCRLLQKGILSASAGLVSFLIQHRLQKAAVCCCMDPSIHERDVVRLIHWRPKAFLPVVLHRAPHLSKPLLVQAFQELFSRERGQRSDTALQTLQQVLSWLEQYLNAPPRQQTQQECEKAPPLELLLDFVTVLVDAELSSSFSGNTETGVAGQDEVARLAFSKVLRRVQDLLQPEDGALLRRLEGRLLAALTSAQALGSGDVAVGHSLVRTVTVSL
ncbi:hypothetical protein BESB_069410 [Besnoitia besnoiti]|uniref:Uncharacterized protein n=1 Tax=Besnoitia besnoiti TaxID=94643 RepID=A0A2A9M8U8_BESBE|nr:hypothetical protein BESB_069410 [Besnoitia besnoiti]PFH34908.1 hypothetical protein BESB_069410 [Besnoitia besnoiti]